MTKFTELRRSMFHHVGRRLCILGCASQGAAFAALGGFPIGSLSAPCAVEPQLAAEQGTSRPATRIGITYFAGRSRTGDDAHLAAALTRELAGQLRAGWVPESATRQSAAQGRRLIVKLSEGGSFADVDLSITGSVLREGTNLRSQVKLTRSSDGMVLWTGTKVRSITDLPILARLIGQEVATRIGAKLAPMPATTAEKISPELYELLLRGTYLMSRYDPDDLASAVKDFDEALEMRPGLPRAVRLRQQAELQLLAWGGEGGARESRLISAGMLRHVLERDEDEAERLIDQADSEMRQGKRTVACKLAERAIDADPRSAPAYALRSLLSARGGDIREAFGDAETVKQLGRPLWGDALRAIATIRSGDTTSGRKLAQGVLAKIRARRGAIPFWDARLIAIALSEANLPRDAATLLGRVDARDPRLRWIRDDPTLGQVRRILPPMQPRS